MPRRIIGGAFLSLDGVMQAPGGPEEDPTGGFAHGGWLAPVFDEGLGHQVDTLFSQPFDLLLGRKTYDIFAAHWPYQPPEDPITVLFNRCSKYVLTRSDRTLDWQGSHRLANLEALAALKAADGPNLVIQGSSTLYPQLLQHGLLDRLVLMVAPIVLGRGKRLFGNAPGSDSGFPGGMFKLIEHRVTRSGVAMGTYEPSIAPGTPGTIQTGSFATQEPSLTELERRDRLRRESATGG